MTARLEKVLDWYNAQPDVQAVVMNGDMVHDAPVFYADVKASLDKSRGKLQTIGVMGNHDAEGGSVHAQFEAALGHKNNRYFQINGYHFFILAPGSLVSGENTTVDAFNTNVPANNRDLNSTVRTWLENKLSAINTEDPGKPIFIFYHWPVANTYHLSLPSQHSTSTFGTGTSNWLFQNYPQVTVFGGHIHSDNNDPRSIWQGGFTSVNVPSINYMELDSPPAGERYLGDWYVGLAVGNPPGTTSRPYPRVANSAYGQGLVVSVKDSQVTIENYDFDLTQGPRPLSGVIKMPQTWKYDVTKPAEFPYTQAIRSTQKVAPVFDTGQGANAAIPGGITFNNIGTTSIQIEFLQAIIPGANPGIEIVHSYEFVFSRNIGGSWDESFRIKQWSDTMLTPRLQKQTYTQDFHFGLNTRTEYRLEIFAFSSFQERSTQCLVAEFKTN